MFLNAIFFLVSSVSSEYYCDPPSIHYSEGNCLMPGGIDDFYNAQMRCINSGGFLPSVVDDNSNDIMFKEMQERDSCTGSWIGMDRRMVWTDGVNLTYTNWDSKDNVTISECVLMLKTKGTWTESACSVRMGFFCIIPAATSPPTTPSISCQPNTADLPTPIANIECHVGKHCPGHWRVITLVAATTNITYVSALSYMNDMTPSCGSNDEMYFMSPGKIAGNEGLLPEECVMDKASSNYFDSLNTNYQFSEPDETADGDDVETLLETTYSCINANRKDNKRGGVVHLLTDMTCGNLCTPILSSNQSSLLNNIISLGYTVKIIKLNNSTTDCTSNVFSQCSQWDNECGVTSVSASSGALCIPYKMPAWLIATIVSVAVIVILIIVAVIVFRYYLKKHGGWQRFWKSMAQQRSNTYGDEPKKIYDEWEIRPENLEIYLERELGSGAFGVVYEGHLSGKRPVDDIIQSARLTSSAFTGKVAVKRVPPHADLLAKRDFEDEVQFMKKLGFHTHILGMNGCLLSADLPLMVLELCEHGDLLGFVRNHSESFKVDGTGSLRPKDLVSISWQISDGLCYLKSMDMIHRDLAARNILITKDLVAKISDFGLCRQAATTNSSSIYISRGGRLPVKWMAPESLRNYHFSFKTDVWSFGIVLWETFTLGGVPFPDVNATAMLEELESGSRPEQTETIPESMYKIMNSCWAESSDERCDIEDVKEELTELLNSNANYYGYVAVSCVAEFDDGDIAVMEEIEDKVPTEEAVSLQSLETTTGSHKSGEETTLESFDADISDIERSSSNDDF